MSDQKKITDSELKQKLTELQYKVTQKDGTEPPFKNAYWDNKEEGLYVDIVSGKPLFSSKDKFKSGTGWPSFTRPLEESNVLTKTDRKFFVKRTEVRSQGVNSSHLGHVFDDGPEPTGKRYCINSASLRFVPVKDLKKEGYEKYLPLFVKPESKVNSTQISDGKQVAILAGGCFWGMEELIRKQTGVLNTEVGYTGGKSNAAAYEFVKTGVTGHAEAVRITFDPTKTSYEKILKFFFKIHDPTTLNKQGNDVGSQYRSAIFYKNDQQKKMAEEVKAKAEKSKIWKKPIVTEIVSAGEFFLAETHHQDYLEKNPGGYTCHFIRPIDF